MLAQYVAFLCILLFASHWLTGRVRLFALRNNILDQPNERSSHDTPTPRGGGIGSSLLILFSFGLLPLAFPESRNVWIGLFGGGLLVATIGWLDDRVNLSAKLRILVHLTAAAWAVYWLGGLPQLNLGMTTLPLGVTGGLAAIVAVVWSTNLYNFMDGIDGIAGAQAVVVGTTTAILLAALGHLDLAMASGVIAATVGGFLVWNWSPAKIFMGDCGSGLLGFLFSALAIASENRGAIALLVWVMLMSVFWIDATATLIRRMLSGEKWYEAHCSHAYQRVVQQGASHRRVAGIIVVINLILSSLAVATVMYPNRMAELVTISSVSILLLWTFTIRVTSSRRTALEKPSTDQASSQRMAA